MALRVVYVPGAIRTIGASGDTSPRAEERSFDGRDVAFDDALRQRVCSEFLEMPGLQLTCLQAQRLWGLDTVTCLQLLESLVDAKFLCRRAHGMYARLTEGDAHPRPQAVKAGIVDDMQRKRKEAV